MTAPIDARRPGACLVATGLLIAAAACGPERPDLPPETAPTHVDGDPPELPDDNADLHDDDARELPPALTDPAVPPDPDIFLPPLDGHATDDDAEPGELESSLDHGAVPYVAVRRRLILDDQGFASGEVTVVTMEADANGAQRYLDHRYGDAPRTPIQLAGVAMLRIETEPHVAIAWTGPTFAVTFQRGQARSEQWLEDLARETVRAVTGR